MSNQVFHRRRIATVAAALALVSACHRGDSPQEHLAKGKEAAAKQAHATAIIEFKNVLQSDPGSVEARFLLGRELLAQGDPKNAEIELQKASDGGYDPDEVVPLLVRTQVLQGESEKAARQIAKGALKTPQANAALQTLVGVAALGNGKVDDAEKAFTAAQAFVPDYPEAMLGHARVLAIRNDAAGAQQQVDTVLAKNPQQVEGLVLKGDLARVRRATPEAIDAYQAAIKLDPRNFLARLDLAGAYIGSGQADLAQPQIDELKKVAPRHPGVAYMDALVAFNKKDFPRANDAINLSLAGAPQSGLSHLLAGAIAIAMDQPAQAETHLTEAVKLAPNSVYARKLLAGVYLRSHQAQKADEVLAPALAGTPSDPTLITLAGEVALQKGDFATASKYFEQAGKINPGDASVRTQGAAMDFARGDEAAGFNELEAASKASVGNPNADIALILARIARKQFDQALTAWKVLEKRQPDNPVTYNLRAAIDMGRGDGASARKSLEHAVELQPTYFPAIANLAAMDARANDVDGARKRFKTLLAKDPNNLSGLLALAQFEASHGAGPDVVVPLLKQAHNGNPTSEQPVVALAAYYASRNDPKQSLAVVQDGLAGSPNSATYLNLVGQFMLQTGSADQALAAYRKLVSLNPTSFDAQMRLGQAQVAANDFDAGSRTFAAALKSRPEAYAAQVAAVTTLLRANKPDQASQLIAQIRQQSPKSPTLGELDADTALVRKQYPEAATMYRRLLAQTPNSGLVTKAYSAIALSGRTSEANTFVADWVRAHPKDLPVRLFDADIALRQKDYARAVQDYRAGLEARPNDPALLNNLAWALWQQKDPQALEYAQKAAQIAPDSAPVADTLGWMLVEQGQLKRGLELLQKASAAAPAQHDIALHLAKAQIKDGKKDAARTTLQALIDNAPDSPEAKESQQLLPTL